MFRRDTARTVLAPVKSSILSKHDFSPIKSITRFPCKLTAMPQHNQPEKFAIRNMIEVKGKIRSLKRAGPENVILVSDFDHTLTKSFHDNKKALSSSEFLKEAFLSPEIIAEIADLHSREKRLRSESLLNFESRVLLKQRKITFEIEQLIRAKINISNVVKMPKVASIIPRARFDSLFKLYQEYKIPFYMLSSGISNVIVSMLDHYTSIKEYDNIHLYSNEMIFNDKGLLTEFKKPYIHLYNKTDILQKVGPARQDVILLGDLIRDTRMAMHINPRNILKIGYLNFGIASEENPERTMEKYAKEYDIVLTTEASLALPELLTRYVLDLESEETVFRYLDENICSEEEGQKSLFDLVERSKSKFPTLGSLVSSRV